MKTYREELAGAIRGNARLQRKLKPLRRRVALLELAVMRLVAAADREGRGDDTVVTHAASLVGWVRAVDVREAADSARYEEVVSRLTEANPDAILAVGLEAALIGHTVNQHHATVAVYDIQRCADILVERDGMSPEEADEYLRFNTTGAYVGENGPLYVALADGDNQ